jgi:acid phosphatase
VVPLSALQGDLAAGAANFTWITPDLCHDGHDCSAANADDFLRELVPRLLATPAWQSDGLLLITWDEDDGSAGNQVATLIVSTKVTEHEVTRSYNHYSLLATIEDLLGVPRLGAAASVQPMTQVVGR